MMMVMSEESGDGSQWCPPDLSIARITDTKKQQRKSTDSADQNLENKDETCKFMFKEPRSAYISLAPTILRFPYNDQRHHHQRLTIWNKTLSSLKVRLQSPDPEVFLIHVEGKKPESLKQLLLYGHTAKTISIKCIPGRYKMAKSTLHLFVHTCRDECECLELPLEIYPSMAWFNLPKTIVMPDVTVGRRAHAIITLPHPQHAEKFFVTFQPSFVPQEAVTLTPMNGSIGGKDGVRQLKITYSPTQYTTVSCVIKVHFPGLSSSAYHEIRIVGRCKPGREAEDIRKEIVEIETFRPRPKRKKRYPRIKLKGVLTSHTIDDHLNRHENAEKQAAAGLFTLAGVMHFLVRSKTIAMPEVQVEESQERPSISGIETLAAHTDLDHQEKLTIYNSIKKKFNLDFEDQESERGSQKGSQKGSNKEHRVKRLKTYQKKDWEELQRLVGIPLFGKAEEFPKYLEGSDKPKKSYFYGVSRPSHFHGGHHPHHRKIHRKSGASAGSGSSGAHGRRARKSISEEERQLYRNIEEEVPKDFNAKERFIQIVRLVILRLRADKRIAKLRVLIEETKKYRLKLLRRSSVKNAGKKSAIFNAATDADREAAKAQNRKSQNPNPRAAHVDEAPAKEGEENPPIKDGIRATRAHLEKKARFSKRSDPNAAKGNNE